MREGDGEEDREGVVERERKKEAGESGEENKNRADVGWCRERRARQV